MNIEKIYSVYTKLRNKQCFVLHFQLAFEGLWSKHTHPKNFPANEHVAEFSDIIGTTHKVGAG